MILIKTIYDEYANASGDDGGDGGNDGDGDDDIDGVDDDGGADGCHLSRGLLGLCCLVEAGFSPSAPPWEGGGSSN